VRTISWKDSGATGGIVQGRCFIGNGGGWNIEAVAVELFNTDSANAHSNFAVADATGADELILTGQIHDHRARLRSFEIVAEVHKQDQSPT